MDALKKIAQILQVYYDKILLGVMLAGLAAVLVMQSCSMMATNEEIKQLIETTGLPTGDLAPIDEEQLRVRLDVDQANLWQPINRVERQGDYQLEGVSISLRAYLRTYGETSLFDPAVYVYSSHDQRNLMHYHTVQNPFTGLYEQASRKPQIEMTSTIPDDPNRTRQPEANEPLIKRVRLVRTIARNLPLMLMKITVADANDKTTWIAQGNMLVDGKAKSVFLRIGDQVALPGMPGAYKVVDMEHQTVPDASNVPREVSSITIREGEDGQRFVLPRRQAVPIGSVTFGLVVLTPLGSGQAPYPIQAGQDQPFPVTLGTGGAARRSYYKITGQEGNDLLAIEVDQTGKPLRDEVYRIPRLKNEEVQQYKAPAPESPTPETMPIP